MKKHILRALALLMLLPLLAFSARAEENTAIPELMQAFLASDGAASEGYASQLGRAFREAPRAVLTALADEDEAVQEETLSAIVFGQNGENDLDFQILVSHLAEAENLTDGERAAAQRLEDLCVPERAVTSSEEAPQPDKTLLYIGLTLGGGALLLAAGLLLTVKGRTARVLLGILCAALAAVVAAGAFFALKKPEEHHAAETTEPAWTQPVQTLPAETEPEETEPAVFGPVILDPEDSDFVRVTDFIPGIRVALAYATEENFTGAPVYGFREAWLRYGTVKKLAGVQAALEERGMSLLIWDAFRPAEAQFRLWDAVPDARYVADPTKGFSSHSRGGTVDVTLTDSQGNELEMPTGFDDFTALADRDYGDCTPEARENALLLENLMEEAGFKPYAAEWWHFTDTDGYPMEEVFVPGPSETYYADCEEFITLRSAPEAGAEALDRIPAGEAVRLSAWKGAFAQVAWQGRAGYAMTGYLRAVP